jgi:two-component system OmpR family response regulator
MRFAPSCTRVAVPDFDWIGPLDELPAGWDLRRLGWSLSANSAAPVCLIDNRGCEPIARCPDLRRCVVLGVASGADRARLLAAGAAEALSTDVSLGELAQRAQRVAAALDTVPRRRAVGPLVLDLLHRDARADRRWLRLHPREFALLWRLAERPGELVSRTQLLRDVWRLDIEPGTNSVEVHVSRLRAKLAAGGVVGVVETAPDGGYRVATAAAEPASGVTERLCA